MRTLQLPPCSSGDLLLHAAVAGVRDVAWLAPRFSGAEPGATLLVTDPEEHRRLELRGTPDDARDVRDLLAQLDAARAGLGYDQRGPLGVAVFLLGYEAAAALDPLAPRHARDPSLGPDALLRVYRSGVRVGSEGGLEAFFPATGPPEGLSRLLAALERLREHKLPKLGATASSPERHLHTVEVAGSNLGAHLAEDPGPLPLAARPGERARHEERVRRCLEDLRAGVLYQANLAHRLEVAPRDLTWAARFFAARAREAMPPFAAFLDDARFGSLVSLSPECFLDWDLEAGRAAAYPIKGTRPRGRTPEEDRALEEELRASRKDEAEHVMIVDLLRNDLGRVARTGGVTVEELMRVVSVRNVHHLESVIGAELLPGVGLARLLEATTPGGSITGAPKSAALDVIHALEAGPRGPYTGILGAVDGRGQGAASILIRTWIRPDEGAGALHVGGGIVVDSDPEGEWHETLAKARAFGQVGEAGRGGSAAPP